MTTEVQIANLALSHIGHKATVAAIDGSEQSREAELCAQFYDLARDTVLERHTWNFTMRRIVATEVDEDIEGWEYVYAKPADTLRIIAVLPEGFDDDYADVFSMVPNAYDEPMPAQAGRYVPSPFVMETLDDGTEVILTDVENARIRYQVRVTDTAKFTAAFTMAVSRMLASFIAGPLIKGDAGIAESKAQRQVAEAEIMEARVHDARQRNVKPRHTVPWLAVR